MSFSETIEPGDDVQLIARCRHCSCKYKRILGDYGAFCILGEYRSVCPNCNQYNDAQRVSRPAEIAPDDWDPLAELESRDKQRVSIARRIMGRLLR